MASHEHEHDEHYGMALGFRVLEEGGDLYMTEVEIAPYVDEPEELGATLVFHSLEGIDPTNLSEGGEEMGGPAWPIDIDDDLTRDASKSAAEQCQAILRQLSQLSDDKLREYLKQAREESGA
jgi:hypothetical protein